MEDSARPLSVLRGAAMMTGRDGCGDRAPVDCVGRLKRGPLWDGPAAALWGSSAGDVLTKGPDWLSPKTEFNGSRNVLVEFSVTILPRLRLASASSAALAQASKQLSRRMLGCELSKVTDVPQNRNKLQIPSSAHRWRTRLQRSAST